MFFDIEEIEFKKIFGWTLAGVAILMCVLVYFFNPQATVRPAGFVNSLQLHDTTFSTLTTIETTEGWYQVEGAASASKGDAVNIRVKGEAQQACIETVDGQSCYQIRK